MPLHGGLTKWADCSVVPAAARTTGTVTGEAVDVSGYERVDIVIFSGTITDGTHTFSLTECDTVGGSYTAVAAADIVPSATGSGANGAVLTTTSTHDNAGMVFSYIGHQPFIRVIAISAGTTTGGVFCAGVVCSDARHAPVATP